ncbi:MAG: exodeoxyribonuclease VII large subunit [Gemmatimonadaceae bacterium]
MSRRKGQVPPENPDLFGLFSPSSRGGAAGEGAGVPAEGRARSRPEALDPIERLDQLLRETPASTPAQPARRRAPREDAETLAGTTFPGASVESAVSVGTLTRTAKDLLEGALFPLWVRGEVSDFKRHRNGHWYFCLRDGDSQVKCVVWSRDTRGIPAMPDDGMQLAAYGQLTVYPQRGEMQLVVRRMEAEGEGLWRKALEQTVQRLTAEGLLAPERKRALPRYPRRIAVITSPDGAALHDIVAVLRRRAPAVEIVVIPAAVQGENAPRELVDALRLAARWNAADTLIIGRGGGGREDLWAFNHEEVARAIARSPIPTISAVGHEVDVTICDLVADFRAPTPSAAAELAVRAFEEVGGDLRKLAMRLSTAATVQVADARERLRRAGRAMATAAERGVERRQSRLQNLAGRLHALSPLATLSRGYAVARADDGRALTSVRAFAAGQAFELVLRDGSLRARTITEA